MRMLRTAIKVLIVTACLFVIGYYALGYLSSYVGWYGYEKWKHRVATSNIDDSKRRGVFERELQFQVDSFDGTLGDFRPYIEKGFRYGRHTSEETIPITDSDYPYQLSFDYLRRAEFGVFIREDQLSKFDSANVVWGYLATPHLPDTVILTIVGENAHSGQIKVWE